MPNEIEKNNERKEVSSLPNKIKSYNLNFHGKMSHNEKIYDRQLNITGN